VDERFMNRPIVAFTGHRPQSLGVYPIPEETFNWIVFMIEQELLHLRPHWCISGMALGVDQMAAVVCSFMGIPWTAAIPFKGQELRWSEAQQKTYKEIMEMADEVYVVSPGGYAAWKMQKRNEYMVNRCDVLLAVWDGSEGGTANCVWYARKVGVPVVVIDPHGEHAKKV
jgi:uncharacterized phage-like protein YoqJ